MGVGRVNDDDKKKSDGCNQFRTIYNGINSGEQSGWWRQKTAYKIMVEKWFVKDHCQY
jgi:hypothetical protein